MKTLHLNLFKKWFVMIYKIIKRQEYREITPYWCNKLILVNGVKKPKKWWKSLFEKHGPFIIGELQRGFENGICIKIT